MQVLQIVLLSGALLFFLVIGYRILYKKQVIEESSSLNRMMVALRRRPASIEFFSGPQDEQDALNQTILKLGHMLHQRWSGIARYSGGFVSDIHGLPSGGEYEWHLFAIYEIVDYAHFRRCVAILEEPAFATLRSHLDIRPVFGAANPAWPENLEKLSG